jgi:hypothetical protein
VKNLIISVIALFFASPALASYLEACDLTATVTEVAFAPDLGGSVTAYTALVKVQIDSATNRGSHNPDACSARIGTSQWLVSKLQTRATVGQHLVIDYFYVNSRGPDGVLMSERWTVLEGRAGKLAYDCWQTDRSMPVYHLQLREPVGPVVSQSLSYNVYVTRDDELVVAEEGVRVNYLSTQTGSIDRILMGQDFDLTLNADQDLGHSIVAKGSLLLDGGNLDKRVSCVKISI